MQVAVTFDVLVADGDLFVGEGAERDRQLVVDGVDEQFVAGPLPLQGQDEGVPGGGEPFERLCFLRLDTFA